MGGVLLYILMFITPNYRIIPHVFFMYPFFLMGFYFNKHKVFESIFERHVLKVTLITGVLYIVLYLCFKKETYIYWSYYSIIGKGWHQLVVDVQRTLTGAFGSLFIIGFLRITYEHYHQMTARVLSYLGRNTLQLYVISMLPFFYVWERSFSDGSINYLLSFLSFIVVMVVSILIIELIKRNQYTNYLFFGNTLKKKSMP